MAWFKWAVLLCLAYIFFMAFISANTIIKETTPVSNDTLLANQTAQTNAFIDLTVMLLPGLLLLLAGWIVVKVLGGAD